MAEVKVWYGTGMWYCNAGCHGPGQARWSTSYGTLPRISGQIIAHVETRHPELAKDLPLAKHGEWRQEYRIADLTPASDG